MITMARKLRPRFAVTLAMLCSPATVFAADVLSLWNPPSGSGVWEDPANWQNTPAMSAFPDNSAGTLTYDVSINTGTSELRSFRTVSALRMGVGAMLDGGGGGWLTVNDEMELSGAIHGLGIFSYGSVALRHASLNRASIYSAGPATLEGQLSLISDPFGFTSASFQNGGTLTFNDVLIGGVGDFQNGGIINKIGSGTASVSSDVRLTNSGSFNVHQGTFQFELQDFSRYDPPRSHSGTPVRWRRHHRPRCRQQTCDRSCR